MGCCSQITNLDSSYLNSYFKDTPLKRLIMTENPYLYCLHVSSVLYRTCCLSLSFVYLFLKTTLIYLVDTSLTVLKPSLWLDCVKFALRASMKSLYKHSPLGPHVNHQSLMSFKSSCSGAARIQTLIIQLN